MRYLNQYLHILTLLHQVDSYIPYSTIERSEHVNKKLHNKMVGYVLSILLDLCLT